MEQRIFSPLDLLTPARLDVAAKCIYARWYEQKQNSDWGKIVYTKHILTMNGGLGKKLDFNTSDTPNQGISKTNIDDFYNQYNEVLGSVKYSGFDANNSVVPISSNHILLDGAHRTAACIYHNKPLTANIYAMTKRPKYNYSYFKKLGLDDDVLDSMVLEYVALRNDCFMLLVYPLATKYMLPICQMIGERVQVICEKKIEITNKRMPINIVQQVYSGEDWLFDKYRTKIGGQKKAEYCFSGGKIMHVFLVSAESSELVVDLKHDIRKLVNIEKHSVHSTEIKQDTIRLAKVFFNRNSLHQLTYSQPNQSPQFWERLHTYKNLLPKNADDFCLHGSAVMEVYGIRIAQDFDYVSMDNIELTKPKSDISLSNEKPELADMSVAETLLDPRNYFYYHGLKFASLQVIIKMKQNRDERKDRHDVRMIRAYINNQFYWRLIKFSWNQVLLWYRRRKTRRKIRRQMHVYKRLNDD